MAQTKIQSVQLSDSGVVPGPYTNADVTVDIAGRITAIANGTPGGGGTVTSVAVDGTLGRITSSGSPITGSGSITLDLATTAVTPGSYTSSNITVDAYGRITSVSNGSSGTSYTAGNLLNTTDFALDIISVRDIIIDQADNLNVIVGYGAGAVIDSGATENVIIGNGAAAAATSTVSNVIIGYGAGDVLTSGSENVIIGHSAGDELLGSAARNVYVGFAAGCASTTDDNIAVGYAAGRQQAIDAGGFLVGSFVVNNEYIRDPVGPVPPYLFGDMRPAYSKLRLQGDFIVVDSSDAIQTVLYSDGSISAGGDAGSSGDVLTSAGPGVPAYWAPAGGGGGLEMNVFVMTGGSGSFDGSLVNNYTSANQRDESPTLLWDPDTYGGQYTCLVNGVYEIVVECKIVGDYGGYWPDDLSAYGVDLYADYPASNTTPQTKLHTRFSTYGLSTGNLGLSVGPSAPVNEAATTSSFTERFIVRSDVGGIVYPKMFAYSYGSSGASANFSMSISFMKISDYTPA